MIYQVDWHGGEFQTDIGLAECSESILEEIVESFDDLSVTEEECEEILQQVESLVYSFPDGWPDRTVEQGWTFSLDVKSRSFVLNGM